MCVNVLTSIFLKKKVTSNLGYKLVASRRIRTPDRFTVKTRALTYKCENVTCFECACQEVDKY